MKKILIIFLLLLIGFSLYAISLNLDLSTACDFAFSSGQEYYVDAQFPILEGFCLTVPISLCCYDSLALGTVGLELAYYPWNKGAFVSFTILELGKELNSNFLEKELFSLNEIKLGWKQEFSNNFQVELQLDVRNPSKTFEDEYEKIRTVFPNYKDLRIRILVGWKLNGVKK